MSTLNNMSHSGALGLDVLALCHGFADRHDMVESCLLDSVCPALCTYCGYSEELEPDAEDCTCSECQRNTLTSALVLMGVM
jgi:hypothetical protein